jgi:hypothetical protein
VKIFDGEIEVGQADVPKWNNPKEAVCVLVEHPFAATSIVEAGNP